MKNKKVLVVLGGTSGEREVSLDSGRACIKALKKIGYEINHDFYCEYTVMEIKRWMEIIKQQYIIVPVKKAGLKNLSLRKIRDFHLYSSISFVRWKAISEINISNLEIIVDKIIYFKRLFLFKLWKIKNKFLKA